VVDKTANQITPSVVVSGNEITVTSDPLSDTAKNILDNTPSTDWFGEKGNSITITLSSLKKINSLDIHWGDKTEINAGFEVQLSKGGGQFLTFYQGKVIDLSGSKIKIEESGISDVRIIAKNKKILISKVEIN